MIRRPVSREYGPVRSYIREMPVDHQRHVEYVKEQQVVYEPVEELEYEYVDDYEYDPRYASGQTERIAPAKQNYRSRNAREHPDSGQYYQTQHPTAYSDDEDL